MTHQGNKDAAQATREQDWHTVNHEELGHRLRTDSAGLSEAEAARRLTEHGFNRLAPPKRQGSLLRFALQFHNILLYVMIGAALITALLGHWIDTAVLLGAVLINAVIGFIQE